MNTIKQLPYYYGTNSLPKYEAYITMHDIQNILLSSLLLSIIIICVMYFINYYNAKKAKTEAELTKEEIQVQLIKKYNLDQTLPCNFFESGNIDIAA